MFSHLRFFVGALVVLAGVLGARFLLPLRRHVAIAPHPVRPIPLALDLERYALYEPPALDRTSRHPLVVALSPEANAAASLRIWQATADRRQWVIFASKTSRNGVDYDKFVPRLLDDIQAVSHRPYIDASQVIATGLSGGAMVSYDLLVTAPDVIKGLIINTGMMPTYIVNGKETREPPPAVLKTFPHDRIAVMLASPTDFRYREMNEDRQFLERLGWRIRWIEFPGGHGYAPPEIYEAASAWMARELGRSVSTAN
jgi:predicted esterase